MATATKAKTDTAASNGTPAPDKSTAVLLKEEQVARKEWYAHFKGSAPKKPYSTEASASLRALEKAKSALVASVSGATSFKEAAAKLNYKPEYASRAAKK